MFDHVYMTGVGSFGYLFIYTPLSLFFTWMVYRILFRRFIGKWIGGGISVVMLSFILSTPLWDVYQIGQVTKQLCEDKSGLHVYKMVEADGFVGDSGIDIWSRYGYLFTEKYGSDGIKFRYTIKNGKEVVNEIQNFTVSYGILDLVKRVTADKHHSLNITSIGDINTKEIFSELVRVKTYPGWLDSLIIGITGTGSGVSAWSCGDAFLNESKSKLTLKNLIIATIKPSNKNRGQY